MRKALTVAKLIEQLGKVDPKLALYVSNGDKHWEEVNSLARIKTARVYPGAGVATMSEAEWQRTSEKEFEDGKNKYKPAIVLVMA